MWIYTSSINPLPWIIWSLFSSFLRILLTTSLAVPISEAIIRADNGYVVVTNAGRFVVVGAGRDIKNLMKTVKVFRIAAKRIGENFPPLD